MSIIENDVRKPARPTLTVAKTTPANVEPLHKYEPPPPKGGVS